MFKWKPLYWGSGLLVVLALLGCPPPPPPPPSGSDIDGPTGPIIVNTCCDGSFSQNVQYTTKSTTSVPVTGTLGPQNDFAALTTSTVPTSIDDKAPANITISGTLKDPCKAGLTSFTMAGASNTVVTNINVPSVPFSKADVPTETPSVGQSPATFSYKVKLTFCGGGPGAPPGPFVVTAATVPKGVDVKSINPKNFAAGAAGAVVTISVSGEVGSAYDGLGKIILQITYSNGKYCQLPGTRISG